MNLTADFKRKDNDAYNLINIIQRKMSFKLCCSTPQNVEYDLIHVALSQKEKSELAELIWYLPEMESYQASHNTIYSQDVYDDYLYSLFIKKMLMTGEDIKYIDSAKPPVIDKSEGDYYTGKICKSCQKIIFHKRITKNKMEELFRHIRNSLAHGCFNIVDDYFIGFDHPKYNGIEYSAVIKVQYNNLVSALSAVRALDTLPQLYKAVLDTLGYEFIDDNIGNGFGDLVVRKNDIYYCLKFKHFDGRYINQTDLQQVISDLRHIDKTDFMFVLVVDSTYSTAKINSYVVNEHISIIDKKFVKEMLEGRDILKELSDMQI